MTMSLRAVSLRYVLTVELDPQCCTGSCTTSLARALQMYKAQQVVWARGGKEARVQE